MKRIVIYECEKCGKKSEDIHEILACESSHMGLTVAEKEEWDKLKKACEDAGSVVSRRCNEKMNKAYDAAIDALLEFEKKHALT